MLEISRIHHMNIRALPEKLDETRDFYRDILGMEEGYRCLLYTSDAADE